MRPALLLVLLLTWGCAEEEKRGAPRSGEGAGAARPRREAGDALAPRDAGGEAQPPEDGGAAAIEPALSDAAFGRLVAALSEPAGNFPSDNFVSNETTVLEAAPALAEVALPGRAYVGVGPAQNLTYLAIARPAMAYILDIRRGNLLEHLVLRAALEPSETATDFLAALTSRPPRAAGTSLADALAALATGRGEPARRDALLARTEALAVRLGLPLSREDRESIRAIAQAFFEHGTSLRYSMQGANRRYPTLAQTLAARGPDGAAGTFVADATSYAFVRALVRANRVVPVVGDFAGPHALRAIGVDMAARGLVLGAFYTSNVEEYLFGGGTFESFADNVRALPTDDRSLLVRVWFDRSRPHPLQREDERMATVPMPVSRMLARPAGRPYRSYWQVITDGLPTTRE